MEDTLHIIDTLNQPLDTSEDKVIQSIWRQLGSSFTFRARRARRTKVFAADVHGAKARSLEYLSREVYLQIGTVDYEWFKFKSALVFREGGPRHRVWMAISTSEVNVVAGCLRGQVNFAPETVLNQDLDLIPGYTVFPAALRYVHEEHATYHGTETEVHSAHGKRSVEDFIDKVANAPAGYVTADVFSRSRCVTAARPSTTRRTRRCRSASIRA